MGDLNESDMKWGEEDVDIKLSENTKLRLSTPNSLERKLSKKREKLSILHSALLKTVL